MTTKPYQAYKQQSVMTMTPGQMLTAVFDELIKQLRIAEIAFEDRNIAEINRALQKSQQIINELKTTLNFDYEISNNLNEIYNYLIRVIIDANIKKDPCEIPDTIAMVTELRDTFAEASRLAK